MQFPNAAKGVSRIHTAVILALIAEIAVIIGAIVALIGAGAGSGGLAIGGGIFVIASPILLIISFILNIVGVNNASKDEDAFKSAMIAIIVGIIASVLASIFSGKEVINMICTAVSKICELLVTWYCVTGIGNLAVKLGDSAVKEKADNIIKIIMATYIISIICTIIAAIFTGKFMTNLASVLSIIAAVFSIATYIMYLSLLSKGKKMLNS